MVAFVFLILIGAVVSLLVGGPMVAFAFLMLGGGAVSMLAGSPLVAFGFVTLGGVAVSLRVGGPVHRVHGGKALAAHLVVRFAAALVLGVLTVKAARYDAARYRELESVLVVPGVLAVLSFASGAVLVLVALANSGTNLCRVGLHRWTDIWSDAGSHRACARCGDRATAKRRAIWSAALLAALISALLLPAAALAVGVYVTYRPLPNYSLARSTACWRAHGYTVAGPKGRRWHDPAYIYYEIRGHHDYALATFAPSQAVAESWTDDQGGSDSGPPPVPVRNVIFGASGTFDDKPILACLRTSKD